MARRKKDSSGAFYFLLLLVVFLLVFLTFVIGAAIVVVWLFREVTVPKQTAALRSEGFELTSAERATIGELEELDGKLKAELEAINEEGSHLSRRNDGYFNKRSSLGKALNARLEPVVEKGKRTEEQLGAYRNAPGNRLSEFIELRATLQGTRIAVSCLAMVAVPLLFLEPSWAVGFGSWVIDTGLWLPDLAPAFYTAVIVSTWSAVGVYFVAREMARGAIAEAMSGGGS